MSQFCRKKLLEKVTKMCYYLYILNFGIYLFLILRLFLALVKELFFKNLRCQTIKINLFLEISVNQEKEEMIIYREI